MSVNIETTIVAMAICKKDIEFLQSFVSKLVSQGDYDETISLSIKFAAQHDMIDMMELIYNLNKNREIEDEKIVEDIMNIAIKKRRLDMMKLVYKHNPNPYLYWECLCTAIGHSIKAVKLLHGWGVRIYDGNVGSSVLEGFSYGKYGEEKISFKIKWIKLIRSLSLIGGGIKNARNELHWALTKATVCEECWNEKEVYDLLCKWKQEIFEDKPCKVTVGPAGEFRTEP